MENAISFYYQEIEGHGRSDDLKDLMNIHKKSFEQHGWTVVHLDESHARQHPLYSFIDDDKSVFATSRNGWPSTRACYMRWLAYATAGHFFADFDVVNYGFTPQDALEMRHTTQGPLFLSGATAMGLFSDKEYDILLQAFVEYSKHPYVSGALEDDVNDMTILLQGRPTLFYAIGHDDRRIARDYSCPGWEEAQLVHYPHHYTPFPRSETVRKMRSPFEK